MSSQLLNLAKRPFLNRRPVRRFMTVFWSLGVLLLGWNIYLLTSYLKDSNDLRTRLAGKRQEIDDRSSEILDLRRSLEGLGLGEQNDRVRFLNEKIAQRTFPWSRLFERLGQTLPPGVRLAALNPSFRDRGGSARNRREERVPSEELVDLALTGTAESDEDLYALVDAFFDDPAFERPRLFQESREVSQLISFTLEVRYRPYLDQPPDGLRASTDDGEPEDEGALAAATSLDEQVPGDSASTAIVVADSGTGGAPWPAEGRGELERPLLADDESEASGSELTRSSETVRVSARSSTSGGEPTGGRRTRERRERELGSGGTPLAPEASSPPGVAP